MSPRRKIPTKAELIQLQKIYKTDEKIGERLGNIPAYLVAYWRRKKNVPKHAQPKFSEKEIKNLWERFGDDDKCGLELGISKAAFYNWRRRYGIKEKPAFLKLEQLELNFPGLKRHTYSTSLYGKQTIIQKVIGNCAQLEKVEIGDIVEIEPDMVISHTDASEVIAEFKNYNTEYVWNANKILLTLTDCSNNLIENQPENNRTVREFVKRQGINNFYDVSIGACNQIAVEMGQIRPGQFIAGTDKYTISYGCLSTIATCIDTAETASVWVTGKLKLQVPKTIRININGRRARGVFTKDIALSVLKQLASVIIKGKTIEYYGSVISRMSISERFTLISASKDIGAKAAACPFDSITRRYLTGRTLENYSPVIADKNAEYDEMYQINIDSLTPQLAKAGSPNEIKPVSECENLPVSMIILGTESNGRFDDLRIAADILKGKHIDSECRLLIYPASRAVYLEALKKGLIRVFVEAGAVVIYPGYWYGCGRDINLLAPGERALATTNGNVINGINPDKSDVYLCSPATAAASALNAAITNPTRYMK